MTKIETEKRSIIKCSKCGKNIGSSYLSPEELENRLPNQSKIIIEVRTNFKPQIEDGEDIKTEIIKDFHNAVHEWVEHQLTENDDFEGEILEIMHDNNFLPKGIKEFMDLGEISISITDEKVEVKQTNLTEEELFYCKYEDVEIAKRTNEVSMMQEELFYCKYCKRFHKDQESVEICEQEFDINERVMKSEDSIYEPTWWDKQIKESREE